MAVNICSLPFELLTLVLHSLPVKDIKKTRLSCKVLNDAASQFLITRAWISSDPEDQNILTAISLHPIISKSIREIVYDGTIYDDRLVDSAGAVKQRIIDNIDTELASW